MATASNNCNTFQCTICKKKGKHRKSVRYCVSCHKHLCTTCLEYHNDMLENHPLVEPSESTSSVSVAEPLTETCPEHPGKTIEMYCKGHDDIGCSVCAYIHHRSCKKVVYILTDISDIFQREKLPAVKEQLGQVCERLKMVKEIRETGRKKVVAQEKQNLERIDKQRNSLIGIIRVLADASENEVKETSTEIQTWLDKNADNSKKVEEELSRCLKQMETSCKADAQMFIMMKKGEKAAKLGTDLVQSTHAIVENDTHCGYNLSNTEQQFSGYHTLGNTVRKFKVTDTKPISSANIYTILGSCIAPDGSILVLASDNYNTNLYCLKPPDFVMKAKCTLNGNAGMCCVSETEVAVCLNQTIQFVSLNNPNAVTGSTTKDPTKSLSFGHCCQGLTIWDGKMYVSDPLGTIYVYSLEGTLIRKVSISNGFERYNSIAINVHKDRLYYICNMQGKVEMVCTDMSGNDIFRTTLQSGEVNQVYCDGRGCVFVYGTKHVIQLTEDGEVVGEIFTPEDGHICQGTLCYDSKSQRLLVITVSYPQQTQRYIYGYQLPTPTFKVIFFTSGGV